MRIDIHSHIIPGVDDGSKSIEMTEKMLSIMNNGSVDIVVATPHYYNHQQSVNAFIEKRDNALQQVSSAVDLSLYPKILTGAEVYYYKGLINEPDIKKLCIQGTDYMLTELPYQDINDCFIDEFREFVNTKRVRPIIAHIERYFSNGFATRSALEKILDMNVLIQVNALSIYNMKSRQYVFTLLKRNKVHCLGTDAHNITARPPFFTEAEALISKRLDKERFNIMMDCSRKIIDNVSIEDIKSSVPQTKFIDLSKWFDKLQ